MEDLASINEKKYIIQIHNTFRQKKMNAYLLNAYLTLTNDLGSDFMPIFVS